MSPPPLAEAPALAAVDTAIARLVDTGRASPARARQLRWVAGELRRALVRPEMPAASGASPAALFSAAPMAAYLRLATAGELRRRAVEAPERASAASVRVRMDCLALIAAGCGVPIEVPERPAAQQVKPVVDARSRTMAYRALAERAGQAGGTDAGRWRMLAICGVVLDTGARAGELCALRLADLRLDQVPATVRLLRRPQRGVGQPAPEVLPLSAGTAAAVRAWLRAREDLVRPVQGTADALWVSLAGNHSGLPDATGRTRRRPSGMPLRPRGLARAYTRAVTQLNADLAGQPGWSPLPYRLEQLRRAITPAPCDEGHITSGVAGGAGQD